MAMIKETTKVYRDTRSGRVVKRVTETEYIGPSNKWDEGYDYGTRHGNDYKQYGGVERIFESYRDYCRCNEWN